MLCDKCKTKEATFHYKVSNNGKTTETHLCADCAKELGISTESLFGNPATDLFGDFISDEDVFGSFFGGLFGKSASALPGAGAKALRGNVCPSCGMTEGELAANGKLGCSECYKTFARLLAPTISKIHGNVAHTGKTPCGFAKKKNKRDEITELKKQLNAAIEAQEYENAAKLRDKIKDFEKEEGDENK